MLRKGGLASLLLMCGSLLFATPAGAGVIYDNGPVNGKIDAHDISGSKTVFDSFYIVNGTTATSLTFPVWIDIGNTFQSVDVAIWISPTAAKPVFAQTLTPTQSSCSLNPSNYEVCTATVKFSNGPALSPGTYWLELLNAYSLFGGVKTWAGWDVNNGVGCTSQNCPSQAVDAAGKSVTASSFVLYDGVGITPSPEPGSLGLLATGAIGIVGAIRRKRVL